MICTYQTSREDFCAIEDTINGVSSVVEQLKKVKVELHLQLHCLSFVLQLLVLPRLSIHKSIRRLEDNRNVELCLVGLCERLIPTTSPKAISSHTRFLGGWCNSLDWCH